MSQIEEERHETYKNATHIAITEDLAHGIKRIFNEVSSNRRLLNVESVWTIDGRIKYRYSNSTRSFEIRSYADYHQLLNSRKYSIQSSPSLNLCLPVQNYLNVSVWNFNGFGRLKALNLRQTGCEFLTKF